MPLGGGTFLVTNKVLPGAYINFVNKARALGNLGERGVVALPLELSWGAEDEIITVELGEFQKESLKILGHGFTATEMQPLREVFKYAKAIKLFRLNSGGVKALATIGGLTATAKHSGSRGNDLKIVVQVNIDDDNRFDVVTYLETSKVDTQTVTTIKELQPNDFVVFDGEGELETTAGVPLVGGTNGDVTGERYSTFLDKVEAEDFTVLAYAGEELVVKSLFEAFTKRLRDDEGIKVTTVLFDHPQADYEGVISVKNNKELVYWVAGATAGAAANESLTNRIYNGEYEVSTKFKKSDFEKAIRNGEFAFYQDGDVARVLTDINSFTNYTPTKTDDFSSNRVIRVLDQIANDVARIFGDYFLGKVTNDAIGRTMFKNELVNYHLQLQQIQAIEGFTSEDVEVFQGTGKRDVIVNEYVKPTDAMEKLYMSVEIQ